MHLLLCGTEEEYRRCSFCLISHFVSCVMKAKAETIQRATVEMSSFSVRLPFLKAQGRPSNSPYLDVPHTFSL